MNKMLGAFFDGGKVQRILEDKRDSRLPPVVVVRPCVDRWQGRFPLRHKVSNPEDAFGSPEADGLLWKGGRGPD
jgi:hypothetical protein